MDTEELRKQALKAINQVDSNPFTRKLGLVPIVQVHSRHRVAGFPVKNKYVGFQNGRHVYNLDARQVIQHLDRHDLEFDLSPRDTATQVTKNPHLRRVKRGLRVFVCYRR